jgi:hypothetical protein
VQTVLLFRGNGNVDSFMIGSIGASGHHGLDLGVQTPHETILFLAITIDMPGSIL